MSASLHVRSRFSPALAAFALVACGAGEGADAAADASTGADATAADVGARVEASTPTVPCDQVPSGTTALCLTFTAEMVGAQAEPGLDHLGTFSLEVFDTPNPPMGELGTRIALDVHRAPADIDGAHEIALSSLPEATFIREDAPSTVYVRALFFDNPGAVEGTVAGFDWGVWYGGMDFPGGLGPPTPLAPVELAPGEVTRREVVLHPLRRLSVTVTTSVTPVGDGQGAISLMASRVAALPPGAPTYGYGIAPCVDLASGPQRVDMLMIGTGAFFVAASFDDLGIETPGEMPPGTLLSLSDYDLATGTGTFDEITLAPDQYSGELSVDLGFIVPLPEGVGVPGPNSCSDLGLPY